ncbi:MAG: O-acetyl-ADP-ribose deacetylase [bacterium]|nr:O-acetyl-ADP-ribose deacetylase [bacterium]
MDSRKIMKANLSLIQGDITKQKTDAIVNAANSTLMGGGGVDGAIHYAGGPVILEECKEIRKKQGLLPTGEAVITSGGKLPAKYVIHTVGPVWKGGTHNEPVLLANCYRNSLNLAKKKGLKSISFPSISTGIYSYPVDKASEIAVKTVIGFLNNNKGIEEVYFVLYDSFTFSTYKKALEEYTKK